MVPEAIVPSYGHDGLSFHIRQPQEARSPAAQQGSGLQTELAAYLYQLEEEGIARLVGDCFTIEWHSVYKLLSDPSHHESVSLLALPSVIFLTPSLSHKGGLSDPTFAVSVSGWQHINGVQLRTPPGITGAIAEINQERYLLSENTFRLLATLNLHSVLPPREKTPRKNRLAWAAIRQAAISAQAPLDNFLTNTIVVTPHQLQLKMRKSQVSGTGVVEIIPEFDGMPAGWLGVFDRYDRVKEQYDIPEGRELIQVLFEPEVVTVLSEIKRMPGRRVAGRRAEAFIRNPFALLGDDAKKVIDEDDFVEARADAGLIFYRFAAQTLRDEIGIYGASILIESFQSGPDVSETYHFKNKDDLRVFIQGLEDRLSKGMEGYAWEGWDLDLLGDAENHLKILRDALAEWSRPRILVRLTDLYDLSHYSGRIQEVGQEKPYYSPYICRQKEDEGWYPDNVDLGIFWTPEGRSEAIGIKIPLHDIEEIKGRITKAKEDKRGAIVIPGVPSEVTTEEAEELIRRLEEAYKDTKGHSFPDPQKDHRRENTPPRGRSLVIKPNVERVDYLEERKRVSLASGQDLPPRLPTTLKADTKLLDHQLKGVARLQRLYQAAPEFCRGVLLADDMGLGKTLQILTFIAKCIEDDPRLDPALIVAPVSLLDNWKIEIEKFFKPGTFTVQTLYGASLQHNKVRKDEIDEQLIEDGLTRFLRPQWKGNANIVLTTYETLRDLEFSLASERWSIMVCDEAQKIKNANALVTRAAKKQRVHFKIPCTGTPVENSLADLWCLFDFIQPGVLGSLNEFGSKYRRPIEAKTEEQRVRVDELRKLVDPQLIRRTKGEVAKDLPKKLMVTSCKGLQMSPYQKQLYSHAINQFKSRSSDKNSFSNHLGLLQYLKRICADPRPFGQLSDIPKNFDEYASKSPKIGWLINELRAINGKQEKAIIFTEYRDIQRLIQAYVYEKLGARAEIINGDTSTSSESAVSRQKKIDAFQQISGFGVIILSPLAVGFGVNIQAANHVIHYTRTWNPAKEDQATDRAYRLGQTKDVYVYCPTVTDPTFKTFEDRLDWLLEWKRDLSKDMLNGTGDLTVADFGGLGDVDGAPVMEDAPLGIDEVTRMDPNTFEVFCMVLWQKQGFPFAYQTPKSRDGGIDVVAIRDSLGVLIQAKSSLEDGRMLGWDAIKEVVAGEAAYKAKHPGVTFGKYSVTNQLFNNDAIYQAKVNNVSLVDRKNIEALLLKHPTSALELEKYLLL